MPGIAKLECNSLFKGKFLMQLKPPGELINDQLQAADLFMAPVGKGHSAVEHGKQQCFCSMGADDFAFESGINEIQYPADVINVGMGQKKIINNFGRHRELKLKTMVIIPELASTYELTP